MDHLTELLIVQSENKQELYKKNQICVKTIILVKMDEISSVTIWGSPATIEEGEDIV